MPFNHLLFEALLPGKTLAEDRAHNGYTSAQLEANAGETVLLFRLDEDKTKEHLKLTGEKCCDYFFLFRGKQKSLLIFVELKGGNLERAEQQLLAAIDAICTNSDKGRSWRRLARAVVVSPTVSPRDRLKIQKAMKAKGTEVYFGSSKKNAPCALRKIEGLGAEFLK
jgi:hypothetical protein